MDYTLREGVRARQEEFGLLFYNSADTRLTFVKSGNLLQIEKGSEGAFTLKMGLGDGQDDYQGRIGRLIETLLRRGLIVGTRTTL